MCFPSLVSNWVLSLITRANLEWFCCSSSVAEVEEVILNSAIGNLRNYIKFSMLQEIANE